MFVGFVIERRMRKKNTPLVSSTKSPGGYFYCEFSSKVTLTELSVLSLNLSLNKFSQVLFSASQHRHQFCLLVES